MQLKCNLSFFAERLKDRYDKINAKEYKQKQDLFNARCKQALDQQGTCEADSIEKINEKRDLKTVNDLKLTEQESNMRAEVNLSHFGAKNL